jgi:isopentenyl-diphosphate delta-isomerase
LLGDYTLVLMLEEQIVLVDEENRPIGVAPKLASHHAQTPLHRAFSCFVFNARGEFLLTQRALAKKVFPGMWTNSCCGHPAPGEATEDAVRRRLHDELGMTPERLELVLPDFRYRAQMDGIVENEFCPVYVAVCNNPPRPNQAEVETCEWVAWDKFVDRVQEAPATLSPWCVLETKQLLECEAFLALRRSFAAY